MAKRNVPSEDAIVRAILKYLRSVPGCVAEKRHGGPMGKRGEPDITGCKGRRFEIEVKRPGQEHRLTKLQEYNMRKWASAGAVVALATGVEGARHVIRTIDAMESGGGASGADR